MFYHLLTAGFVLGGSFAAVFSSYVAFEGHPPERQRIIATASALLIGGLIAFAGHL